MKAFFIRFALLSATLFTATTVAADHAGKAPHDQKCMGCHKTEVYTRDNRTIKTLNALSNQVNNCMKGAAKAEWTEKRTGHVIDYLNSKFYKF